MKRLALVVVGMLFGMLMVWTFATEINDPPASCAGEAICTYDIP